MSGRLHSVTRAFQHIVVDLYANYQHIRYIWICTCLYNDTIFTWLSLSAGCGSLFGIKGLHADKKYSHDPNEGNFKFSIFALAVINGKIPHYETF